MVKVEKEIWRAIPGYEDLYEASSFGKIRSIRKGIILKDAAIGTKRKYRGVALFKNGKATTKKVHRLVAMSFLPIIDGKHEVNHIDGNTSNNRLSNLEWVNSSENMFHAHRTGLFKPISKDVLISNGLKLLSKLANSVEHIPTGTVYRSMKEASKHTGDSRRTIKEHILNTRDVVARWRLIKEREIRYNFDYNTEK